MKHLLLLVLPLGICSPALAQFHERPATTANRASRLATHVEGNMRKVLDFAVGGRVIALGFSPKGDFLSVATATTLFLFKETGTRKLSVWDALKEPQTPFEGRPPLRASLAFSGDGKQLFFCGPQGLSTWSWPDGPSRDQNPMRGWSAPDVYNLAVLDNDKVVCAAKKGSQHFLQLRATSDGHLLWEKQSGLLTLTTLLGVSGGATIRTITGTPTNSQANWNEWSTLDGQPSLPTDLGPVDAFSASFSPDGKSAAVVDKELSILTLDSGDAKVATAPRHPPRYPDYRWHDAYPHPYDWKVDTGWTTLFSPDGQSVVTIGREVVFYDKSSGLITARIYFSNNPFPDPDVTQAETDGIGCFSPDGAKFILVRQARVTYSTLYNAALQKSQIQRQVQGNSAVEVYALGDG